MKLLRFIFTLSVLSLLFFIQANVVAFESPFPDVQEGSPEFVAINYLKKEQLVLGYPDGTFRPDQKVTRAEAVAMILRPFRDYSSETLALNISPDSPYKIIFPEATSLTYENIKTGEKIPIPEVTSLRIESGEGSAVIKPEYIPLVTYFKDVLATHWFYEIINRAKQEGVVNGEGDGTYFRPENPVNLAHALRMLFTASDTGVTAPENLKSLPGVDVSQWYGTDMLFAVSKTILNQRPDGSVMLPDTELDRGTLALLIYRHLRVAHQSAFGYASFYPDDLGRTGGAIDQIYVNRHMTAAHRTLPMGSIVRVTNMKNGRAAEVVINDRGPYITGRIIDLSKSAFEAIEYVGAGVTQIELEVISVPN